MNDFYSPEEDRQTYGYFEEDEIDKKGKKIRLWIIGFLCITSLGLFIVQRYVTVIKPNLDFVSGEKGRETTGHLENDIKVLLENYGLNSSWIESNAIDLPVKKNVRTEWNIKLPREVPMATITYDLNIIAQNYGGIAYAVEDTKLHDITVHIEIERKILHSLCFHRTNEVKRTAGSIALFYDGIENAPGSEVDAYLAMQEPVACVMQAKRESRKIYSRLVDANKMIILHFHFLPRKDTESKFELSEDLSNKAIVTRIKNILHEFPHCAGYYITSERISGDAIQVAEKEILLSKLKRIPTADIQYIDRGSNFSQMSSRMNDVASVAVKEGHAIGVLELRENTTSFIGNELIRLRKRGFDFVPITRLLTPTEEQKTSE